MDRNARVGLGVGAIHNPPKAKYSEETRNLMKVLMEESKLTMKLRKSIQNAVDKGESLPPPTSYVKSDKKKKPEPQVMFPSAWKKRSQDIIVKSGAYEREQFRRTSPLTDKENEKRHFACLMAYGKEMPPTPRNAKAIPIRRELEIPDDAEIIEELIRGIRERIEFLQDMQCLGQGKKYRPMIQQEIAEKLRLIEKIDKEKFGDVRKEIGKYKVGRSTPEPFPLGELGGI